MNDKEIIEKLNIIWINRLIPMRIFLRELTKLDVVDKDVKLSMGLLQTAILTNYTTNLYEFCFSSDRYAKPDEFTLTKLSTYNKGIFKFEDELYQLRRRFAHLVTSEIPVEHQTTINKIDEYSENVEKFLSELILEKLGIYASFEQCYQNTFYFKKSIDTLISRIAIDSHKE